MRSEELLAHADFIKALARSLVLDENSADDVTQDTWLAALEHPPRGGWAVKAWLARVTRNFAFRSMRSERRRAAREAAVGAAGGVGAAGSVGAAGGAPSPEVIVAREESRRHVIDSLLGLDEPYRSTLLLRFYEDLSVRDVARRLAVPEDTVRTRMRRGLERMRGRLDARYRGDRMLWGLALAPFAGLRIDAAAAAKALSATPAAAGIVTLITGALLMTGKAKLITAAILLLAALTAVVCLVPDRDGSRMEAPSPEIAATPPINDPGSGEADEESGDAGTAITVADDEETPEKVPLPPRTAALAGVVTEKDTGEPVAAYSLAVVKSGQPVVSFIVDRTVRDEAGRFHCSLDAGVYDLWIRTPDHLFHMTRGVEMVPGEEREDLLIELDRGKSVPGSVVDDATDRPVPGAVIMPWSRQFNHAGEYLARLYSGQGEVINHTRSDEAGRFRLFGLRGLSGNVVAVHPDYVVASEPIVEEGEVRFRLKGEGYRVFGRVRDPSHRPVAGIAVFANSDASWLGRPAITDDDGRYRTAPIPAGLVYLHVDQGRTPDGEELAFGNELKRVLLEGSDVEVNFGPSTDQARWEGTLFDEDGEPIAGGKVFLYPAEVANITSIWMKIQREEVCDDAGRFAFDRIEPGEYNVTVYSDRHRYRDWRGIAFAEPGLKEQDIRLSLPDINGVVADAETGAPITGRRGQLIALSRETNRVGGTSSINEQGRFAIGSLPPGIYDLSVNMPGYTTYRKMKTLVIREGERAGDLKIALDRGGAVGVTVTGIGEAADQGLNLSLRHERGRTVSWPLAKQGDAMTAALTLERGLWTAALSVRGLGYAERTFNVAPGGTARIAIGRKDFSLLEEPVTVTGALSFPGGKPAADCLLRFTAGRAVQTDGGGRVLKAVTDADGAFELAGIRPGAWSIHADIGGEVTLRLDDLIVPPRPADPLPCALRLADGAVTGSASVRGPGGAGEERGEDYLRVALVNVVSEKEAAALKLPVAGGPFELRHIPQGRYELRIGAKGFRNRASPPFDLVPGQEVDLGDFVIEPAGA